MKNSLLPRVTRLLVPRLRELVLLALRGVGVVLRGLLVVAASPVLLPGLLLSWGCALASTGAVLPKPPSGP